MQNLMNAICYTVQYQKHLADCTSVSYPAMTRLQFAQRCFKYKG